jgi:hypothetical protein
MVMFESCNAGPRARDGTTVPHMQPASVHCIRDECGSKLRKSARYTKTFHGSPQCLHKIPG